MAETTKKKKIQQFVEMTVGVLMMAVGIYFFKIPNGFSTGGVSGIATVLGKVFQGGKLWFLTPATIIFALNILLLLIGYLFLGKSFGIKTVYCSLVFPASSGFSSV